jgi:hypothetical protein
VHPYRRVSRQQSRRRGDGEPIVEQQAEINHGKHEKREQDRDDPKFDY